MKLDSVVRKIKSGTEVAIYDFATGFCYGFIEAEKLLDNKNYYQRIKAAKVVEIGVSNDRYIHSIIIKIIKE